MTLNNIIETASVNKLDQKPIQEKQDIYIPGVKVDCVPNRNGFIYTLSGSGGSGKTSLFLNMIKSNDCYKGKFSNIYYFCPLASFLSVKDHPFEGHDKVYHELTAAGLMEIYNGLEAIKVKREADIEKLKKRAKSKQKSKDRTVKHFVTEAANDDGEDDDEEPLDTSIQYSLVIIDDFAGILKEKDIQNTLNKILPKARHICCSWVFTLQSYLYFPKILRKQITNITLFKPKNIEEWYSVSKELIGLKADDALFLHDYVFNEPYNHLDVDTTNGTYHKNFNKLSFEFGKLENHK
jgi:hypothetical protein